MIKNSALDETVTEVRGRARWFDVQRAADAPWSARPCRVLRAAVRAPFTARAWAELAYAVAGFPLGILGAAYVVVTFVLGTGLLVTLVGLPVIAAFSAGARLLGAVRRALARALLHLAVEAPERARRAPGFVGWVGAGVGDSAAWRARAYLLISLPLSVMSFAVVVFFRGYGLVLIASPILWSFGYVGSSYRDAHGHERQAVLDYGDLHVDTWPEILLLVLQGMVMLLAAPWVLRGVLSVETWLIPALLGPSGTARRVRDLERTRALAVEDAAAQLRRIERDLHDGTQAQLVALAMKLGLASEKLDAAGDTPAEVDLPRLRELVGAAHRGAKEAIVELRDLARGIHPPVLDTGLGTALTTLAARSPVQVDLQVDVPADASNRPSAAIEAIAYYCAAELLTNAVKHAGARRITVDAARRGGMLRLRVRDDGTGGAHAATGGGLAGLAERVGTVDGRLVLDSPPGGPTVMTVELPLHV
ncbi:sensor domain-containing protein [Pseudofrankia sp. BMG5.37]|nr:sensor domain-containing protein [Pseudofrankia sp. BMG5.37]MDT3438634.1 sensor domain-containing protein [Pseudofrankia sp. BMG5.37]